MDDEDYHAPSKLVGDRISSITDELFFPGTFVIPTFAPNHNTESVRVYTMNELMSNCPGNLIEQFEFSDGESDDDAVGNADIFVSEATDSFLPCWRDNELTICHVCNVNFLSWQELFRHFMDTLCGSMFSTPIENHKVSRISILPVSEKVSQTFRSTPPPHEGPGEVKRLVRNYLMEHGYTEDCSDEEDPKVLEVVVDKMLSPERVPKCKNSPLDVKLRNDGQLPNKKYRGVNSSDLDAEEATATSVEPVYKPANTARKFTEVRSNVKKPGETRIGRPTKNHKTSKKLIGHDKVCGVDIDVHGAVSKAGKRVKSHSRQGITTVTSPEPCLVDYICDLCDYNAESDAALQYHFGAVHDVSVCPKCQVKISDPIEFQDHLKKHVDYYCRQCQRSFTTKLGYAHHVKGHGDGQLYECDMCNDLFQTQLQLRSHLRTHAAEKTRHTCDQCSLGYHSREQLHKHQLRHNYLFLNCGVCGQACDSRIMLEVHQMTHVLVRNARNKIGKYECKICGYRMSNLKLMHEHLNMHTVYGRDGRIGPKVECFSE